MSLWGNIDHVTSNNKPLFANTSNISSNSVINGSIANTSAAYGIVYGISATEMAGNEKPAHAGWVSQKVGTGPIATVAISSGGAGYNSAGYLTITDGSPNPTGTGANISYTIANAQNSLQSYSTNAHWNTISTLTIVNGGSGYKAPANVTIQALGGNIAAATITFTLGGRAGRINYETLVAMGSITLDDPKDNVFFSGI